MGSDELQRVREEYELAEFGARYALRQCEKAGRVSEHRQRDFDYWLGEMDAAARRAVRLSTESRQKREQTRKQRDRQRAQAEAAEKWRDAVRRVSRHEGAHAVLMETSATPVDFLSLEESGGRVHGRAVVEPGYKPPPWAAFARGGRSDVASESDSDLAYAWAGAAATVAPGRSVWQAARGPHFDSQLVTWRHDAKRVLEQHQGAVDALGRRLVEHRHLDGDEVRDILRQHGVPVSK